ncbi:MAG: NAD(P)/FAD-dependent oxidoreductase [Pseudomonadota bacterium]|nr:NAD(P)/FAD-dependent oxidoreductase [Pseudomonadota bacterium]
MTEQSSNQFDAIVVGAGFAGLYMTHKFKQQGLTVKTFEAGEDVGGTWYWNRYPGARCDVESWEYSFGFSTELEQEWTWSERYSAQPEILEYLKYVAKKFNLKKHVSFNTRVKSGTFNEETAKWEIETDSQKTYTAKYFVMATGCLSSTNIPKFDGLDEYTGQTFHTGNWPHEPISFKDKIVGVIGTGSSSIQATPIIAKEAKHLYVFQRTPNWSIPAHNEPLTKTKSDEIKSKYQELRQFQLKLPLAAQRAPNRQSAFDVDNRSRVETYEKFWEIGGLSFLGAFRDIPTNPDANATAKDFIINKIKSIVKNDKLLEKLIPDHHVGCKRPCSDTGYYETFNRKNVELIDARDEQITGFTPYGIATSAKDYKLDAVVFATGFDAMTGSLDKVNIIGKNGLKLKKKWEEGPKTYLGVGTAGFPNFFIITGPGSPSVLANMVVGIEHHVNWIGDCVHYIEKNGYKNVEVLKEAEEEWVTHVNEVANRTLYTTCNNWYLGSNIPGKPRVFMPYIGGFPKYAEKVKAIVESDYKGFAFS